MPLLQTARIIHERINNGKEVKFFNLLIITSQPLYTGTIYEGMEIKRKPVLARASEIFPQLTLGSFAKVATQHGTKGSQVIVGVRQNGTRDQLYLALRIASLEHHVNGGTYSG